MSAEPTAGSSTSSAPSEKGDLPEANPHGILIAFSKEIANNFQNYPTVTSCTELEEKIALKLFQSFHDLISEDFTLIEADELVFLEDFSADEQGRQDFEVHLPSNSDSDDKDDEDKEYCPSDDETSPLSKIPKISLDRKKKIVAVAEAHPRWSWKSVRDHGCKEVTNKSTLQTFRAQVQRGLSREDVFKQIRNHVLESVQLARQEFKIIRSTHLRKWAFQKYLQLNTKIPFKAGRTWINSFKQKNRIGSRKINILVSKRQVKSQEEILASAKKFQEEIKSISAHYDPKNIYNTDQCGFNYEVLTKRTLTFKGEKTVMGFSQSPTNLATHSYTVQYVISAAGKILGNVFMCLQETGGKLGPRVKQDIEAFCPPNVTLTCSSSGKLSTSLNEYFLEKQVVPHVKDDFLWIIDSWSGHTNIKSYDKYFGASNNAPEIKIKVIPEKCTPIAQPLDTTFHRQLKILAREILAGLEIFSDSLKTNQDENWTTRKGVIKLQSLLHHQLIAPIFEPMIRYSWFSSGLCNEDFQFENVKEVCFTFLPNEPKTCGMQGCEEIRFLKCANCRVRLCLHHFWFENHLITCEKTTF